MNKIPVFFHEKMVADSEAFSPSARKPEAVMRSWFGWVKAFPVERRTFEPVTQHDLVRAHDVRYVRDVLACRRTNGFNNRSRAVARSLPYTAGAMYAAAEEATKNGCVAVAPVSGFHHAGYDHGGGFCTFNGLMVAALKWQANHGYSPVGIVDYDCHYGNGTDDIIRYLGSGIRHWTYGGLSCRYPSTLSKRDVAKRVLRDLVVAIRDMARTCGVILYQAGADPHINDPLGGYLTSEDLVERDVTVFEECKRLGLPVAWNLAGGYQTVAGATTFDEEIRPVLDIHDATMRACVNTFVTEKAHAKRTGTAR